MDIKQGKTDRGWAYISFCDFYDHECSIQKSSLATEAAIWLGINNAEPKIMHSDAKKLGIKTDANNGWVDYPIPEDVLLHTRMHLTREQVAELLPILQYFVDNGELPEQGD